MNQCDIIHETVLRDIIDILIDVKDMNAVQWRLNKSATGSIAKQASNLILVFPVLASTSLNIQSVSIIAKAIERKCVALLQILFASVNMTHANDLREYISAFHSNLDKGITIDEFLDALDKLEESGEIQITDIDAYEMVREDLKNLNYHLDTSFNETSIGDYHIKKDYMGNTHVFKEAKGGIIITDKKKFYKAIGDKATDAANKAVNNILGDDKFYKAIADKATNAASKVANGILDREKMALEKEYTMSTKDAVDYFRYQLLPQDIQKANELMPTLMTVSFTSLSDNETTKHTKNGIVGVKAKIYPVNSMDIVNKLASKLSDSNGLFNFVKATTREISFFRDFVFAVDKAKLDGINVARESNSSKIFKLLERRADKNKLTRMLKKNDASAITSLVISQDEVEYLLKYHNIDMTKTYVTRTLMEKYNLMDIVLADESLEIAKFLYDDGNGVFETLTFDSLEKEAKDSSYKKVVNLMSKINR